MPDEAYCVSGGCIKRQFILISKKIIEVAKGSSRWDAIHWPGLLAFYLKNSLSFARSRCKEEGIIFIGSKMLETMDLDGETKSLQR